MLQRIVAISLYFVDAILAGFAGVTQATAFFNENMSDCGVAGVTVLPTACGTSLVNGLQTIVVAGLAILTDILPALNQA